MSRELANGAQGWRYVAALALIPLEVTWALIEDWWEEAHAVAASRPERPWTDGTE